MNTDYDYTDTYASKPWNVTYSLAYVLAQLRLIVEEFGTGHMARKPSGEAGCIYAVVKNGALVPVCIIGHFFAREGLLRVLVDDRGNMNLLNTSEPANFGACETHGSMFSRLANLGINVDDDAQRLMRYVQSQQDVPTPWGEALDNGIAKFITHAEERADNALAIIQNTAQREHDAAVQAVHDLFS